MEIRPIRAAEYEIAGEVVVAAYESIDPSTRQHPYATELADVARRAVEARVLVAVEDGEVLGCVTFVPDGSSPWAEELEPGEAGIRMLGVAPAAQGRGAGRALTESCISEARALGRRAVSLHSRPSMVAAHRLYESLGFVRVPERDWEPVPGIDLWAFNLKL